MKTSLLTAPDYIKPLKRDFDRVSAQYPANAALHLAKALMDAAQDYDLAKTAALGVNFRYAGAVRNAANPAYIRHESVIGKDWADDEAAPLQQGEEWHKGRRATLTGQSYALNAAGHPVNPYFNTGLTGQGALGQFGPNHAVDNGIMLQSRRDEQSGKDGLYALGIIRRYDNNAPAFSGGFAKFHKDASGAYTFDNDAIITSKAEEFFEEMVSGSIPLLPAYEAQVEPHFEAMMQTLSKARGGATIGAAEREEIKNQIITEQRLKQVEDCDPSFMQRLKDVLAKGRACFAGPVLNDNRSTNNAWIETQLSWIEMDDATWTYICGSNPRFPYALSAGDDAAGVVWHKIDGDLMDKAFASHGAMFAFMAASYLIDSVERAKPVSADVFAQMEGTKDALHRLSAALKR